MDKKKIIIAAAVLAAAALIAVLVLFVVIPKSKYDSAVQSLTIESYDSAIEAFEKLGDYKDSAFLLKKAKAGKTKSLIKTGNYDEAIELCNSLTDYDEHSELVVQLADAILYDEDIYSFEYEQYFRLINELPAKYYIPIANYNAKEIYSNCATYFIQCEAEGYQVKEGWYFFELTDKSNEEYLKDGEHLPDMICNYMGLSGGYAAVYIGVAGIPDEAYWSPVIEFDMDKIDTLPYYPISDSFVYGSYPTETS